MKVVLYPRITDSGFSRPESLKPVRLVRSEAVPIVDGSKLWAELHTKRDATPEWFAEWLSRVPNFRCSCRRDFEAIILANPPRYNDWFKWTVEIHNSVNKKLGKSIVTFEAAMNFWMPAD